ncbi:Glucose--fructose oxidoreductase [bioreactor metagenome]|uniref:Glucose--fructose oxidoreductase n=1 Tax=bioreactor metagenome TaxID=1076179 RepID=A0A645B0V1_9ZZZZ|nr:Gfo/Idh/MocA family oxidoreductase [Oscillospiraceae bacterium]
MGKLRIGIIGSGGISACHTHGYSLLPNCQVVACCDINEAKAAAYAQNYNIPAYYTDYNEMLAKEKLDAVSVTTWNAAHMPASVAALNAGVNVLCEKPMAMNSAEAQLMADTAKKNNKLLQIGFVMRYNNTTEVMENLKRDGALGDIYYAKATYLRRNGCPGGWFGDKSYAGGGPLIDLGVHVMDIVRYLGGLPKPVSAYGATFNNLGRNRACNSIPTFGYERDNNAPSDCKYSVEDFATAMIRFDNGLVLSVEASFNLNIKEDVAYYELFGTKAGLKVGDTLEMYTQMNDYFVDVKPYALPKNDFTGAFNAEIAHFIDCVANGTKCKAPAEDGVILMKMIDAIYESAKTGHEVIIK